MGLLTAAAPRQSVAPWPCVQGALPLHGGRRAALAEGVGLALALGLGAAFAPGLAVAVPLTPNPNPSGSTITIDTDPVDNEDLVFQNNGVINIVNGGGLHNLLNNRIDNAGEFNLAAGAYFDTDGAFVNKNTGTVLNNNNFFVGGAGSFTNETGGQVTNHYTFVSYGDFENQAGATLTTTNTMRMHRLTNAGDIVAGAGALFEATSFTQTAGTTQLNTTLELLNGATANFTGGTLMGMGQVTAALIEFANNAELSPGNSAGTLTFLGDTNFGGDLIIEINGTTPGTGYDVIDALGTNPGDFLWTFTTDAEIQIAFGFTPGVGNQFEFLLADSVVGFDPAMVTVTGLNPALFGYDVALSANGLTITVESAPTPGTLALVPLGLLGLRLTRRRRA